MLTIIGYGIMVVGLLLEACAVLAMTSYRLRQRLPCRSPFTLQSIGFCVFVAGAAVAGAGEVRCG